MILVALPKSASTSLEAGLGSIMSVPHRHVCGKRLREDVRAHGGVLKVRRAPGWWGLSVSSALPIPHSLLSEWSVPDFLYREHLVPIRDHVLSLMALGKPFVTLLRNPEMAADSHARSGGKVKIGDDGVNYTRKGFRDFVDGWVEIDSPLILRVWFEDLILDQSLWVNRILEHFGRSERVGRSYEIPKMKYTGVGLEVLGG